MITHKKIFFIGILLIIIPLLGLPLFWKFVLIILCAIVLILSSVTISLPLHVPKQFSNTHFFPQRKKIVPRDIIAEEAIAQKVADLIVPVFEKPLEYEELPREVYREIAIEATEEAYSPMIPSVPRAEAETPKKVSKKKIIAEKSAPISKTKPKIRRSRKSDREDIV